MIHWGLSGPERQRRAAYSRRRHCLARRRSGQRRTLRGSAERSRRKAHSARLPTPCRCLERPASSSGTERPEPPRHSFPCRRGPRPPMPTPPSPHRTAFLQRHPPLLLRQRARQARPAHETRSGTGGLRRRPRPSSAQRRVTSSRAELKMETACGRDAPHRRADTRRSADLEHTRDRARYRPNGLR